uniref:Uncharacterized protein n=1 Tax=Alexandrium monilatum TaxID=311494 RepID=A0A7S4UPQ6_9DINO
MARTAPLAPLWHGRRPPVLHGCRARAGLAMPPMQRLLRTSARSCAASSASTAGSSRPLRELWDRPPRTTPELSSVVEATARAVEPSAEALRRHFESAHHWQTVRILGDQMTSTPPSAAHVFYSCGVIEGIFLCVNAGTFSPLIFEMFMPYHLKYTGLVIAWWGGTYWGLNIARYGPLSCSTWFGARAFAGVALVTVGVVGLVLADGVGQLGPWPSYWVLLSSYTCMGLFDICLHRRQMIPPWLLRWKIAVSGIIAASLLLGVLKGKYLEHNAQRLIFEAAA